MNSVTRTTTTFVISVKLKSEDLLLVSKVDESGAFVDEAAVNFNASLKVGGAHVLAALSLQATQGGPFGTSGTLQRPRAASARAFPEYPG